MSTSGKWCRVGWAMRSGPQSSTRFGNEVIVSLDQTLEDAITTDVRPEIGVYGHSVGNNSHDIGARIAQDLPFAYGERVRFPLVEGEFVSVEFHLSTPIPEWNGKTWYSRFEENARLGAQTVEWLIPRQEKLILIYPASDLRTNP